MVKNINAFLKEAGSHKIQRMMALKMSEQEAYKTAEMTSWYYYLALRSKVSCLCHCKCSKACYVSQIGYNPSILSPTA